MTTSAPAKSAFVSTAGIEWKNCALDSSTLANQRGPLGLRLRAPVPGPEEDMVQEFLSIARASLPRGRRLTVFLQPEVETGFPDLVAVVWRPAKTKAWPLERERLREADLRLLHLLATAGPLQLSALQTYFQRGLAGMLRRLDDAGVIVTSKATCRARSLSTIFAVEQIVAIEAKVSAHRRAIEQAGANTWFSSESHALLRTTRVREGVLEPAANWGVGVLCLDAGLVAHVAPPSVRAVPLSYGSWLFNEWTWRVARETERL